MAKRVDDGSVPYPPELKQPPRPKRPPKKTYWEKLKDPRWQRKRLEVMEAAEFACEACGDKESTLNVHHGYYAKGHEPWEYEIETLHCLCERCHVEAEDVKNKFYLAIASMTQKQQRYMLKTVLGLMAREDGDIVWMGNTFETMPFDMYMVDALGCAVAHVAGQACRLQEGETGNG